LEWLPDELPKVVGDLTNSSSLQLGVRSDDKKAVILLGLIYEFASRGTYCDPGISSHSQVHKVLNSEPTFKKLNLRKEDTRRILNQCQRDGWLAIEEYSTFSRNKKLRWVLTEMGKSFAESAVSASNALNASNQSFNAIDGIDAPASNIVGGMGDLRTQRN